MPWVEHESSNLGDMAIYKVFIESSLEESTTATAASGYLCASESCKAANDVDQASHREEYCQSHIAMFPCSFTYPGSLLQHPNCQNA